MRRPTASRSSFVLALGLVLCGSTAHAQKNPNALPVKVNVNVGSPTVQVGDRGAKAAKGETDVTSLSSSVSTSGATPTITTNINVRIRINTAAIGKEYTVKEKGPCQGVTFVMTQGFIEAHERQHVAQIQGEVEAALAKGVTYNANTDTVKVTNGGSAANRPGDPATIKKLNDLAQATVDRLVAQDRAEYENKSFPAKSLEGEARAKACETLTAVINQMTTLLEDAQKSLPDVQKNLRTSDAAVRAARTAATAASKAADEALAAAKACDLDAFQAALKKYEANKKKAEDKAKEATALDEQIAAQNKAVETAITNYENLKTTNAAGLRITGVKTLDKTRDDLRKSVDRTKSKLETHQQTLKEAEQRLAQAATTLAAAYEALKKCEQAKDEKNKAWQSFIGEHRTELGMPAAGTTPADEPDENNSDPDEPRAPQDPQDSNSGISNPQTSSPISFDFGQTSQWAPSSKPLPREKDTQLMIIDLLDIQVPNTQVARVDPVPEVPGFFARIWRALASGRPMAFATRAFSPRTLWLDPLGGGGGQGVTRATRVHAYLISLGNSTGEAFDIQIVNNGSEPIRLTGDGVVVRPIKSGADKQLRSEIQQVANRRSPMTNVRANAYCLEFKLDPPARGKLFEVADASTQDAYGPAREILHASRRLEDAGELEPDSDPTDYFHAIRQWSIWVNEQNFTLPRYRDAFIERAKKNLRNMKGKWTKELENALASLVPHRWDEITKILREADQPVPGA